MDGVGRVQQDPEPGPDAGPDQRPDPELHEGHAEEEVGLCKISGFSRKICKFLADPFSAVPKRNFARKYAFDGIFQALQDLHPFAPLQSQNFRKKSV